MKTYVIFLRLIAILALALSAFSQVSQELRYNFEYSCNKERIVIDHCRHDSDMPGVAPTRPENDYCQVYYPDRPKTGGCEAMGTVLRGDVIKTLSAFGAFAPALVEPGQSAVEDLIAGFKVGITYYIRNDYPKAL